MVDGKNSPLGDDDEDETDDAIAGDNSGADRRDS